LPNKVLILTYYWPPSGGAGVQRWLKFAKYLPEFGWQPYILTVDPDYAAYLTENRESSFVLAIAYPTLKDLGRAEEDRRMEQECRMIVGRKTYPMVGHFPPTPSDPVLRLVFPRVVKPADKTIAFRLYLAGLNFPERELEFRVKDLLYRGKLAM